MSNFTIRETILEAARVRFGHYGFNKTTMVEIAKDCGMSAANIYRHFNGKNDIIAVLATNLLRHQETRLAEIVACKSSGCAEKLRKFFIESIVITRQYAAEQPKMKEMVDFICQERLDLVQSHKKNKQGFIETILREGASSGEFIIADSDMISTAEAVLDSTVMFHTPLFMDMYSTEDLKSSCDRILKLILAAITRQKQD